MLCREVLAKVVGWMAKKKGSPDLASAARQEGLVEKIAKKAVLLSEKAGMEKWVLPYFDPKAACEKTEKKPSFPSILLNLLYLYFLYSAFLFCIYLVVFYIIAPSLPAKSQQDLRLYNPLDPSFLFITFVVNPAFSTMLALIFLTIVFAAAKLLGGKAGYDFQTYALSNAVAGGVLVLSFFLALLALDMAIAAFFSPGLPFADLMRILLDAAGLLIIAAAIVSFIYWLHQMCKTVEIVHQISFFRALAAMASSILLSIILNMMIL
jgi:hypothetical protein